MNLHAYINADNCRARIYLTRTYCRKSVKLEEEFRKANSVSGSGGRCESGGVKT